MSSGNNEDDFRLIDTVSDIDDWASDFDIIPLNDLKPHTCTSHKS